MVFVPTTHTPVDANVSPRARDLARNLEKALEEYRTRNPTVSDAEIRQALMLMGRSRTAAAPAVLLGLLAAGLLAGAIVAFMAYGGGVGSGEGVQWIAMVVGGLAAILGVVVAARRRFGG